MAAPSAALAGGMVEGEVEVEVGREREEKVSVRARREEVAILPRLLFARSSWKGLLSSLLLRLSWLSEEDA